MPDTGTGRSELPPRAEVVVIGGGVIGCSIAYHLARFQSMDVVLLERQQLTSGTTWHAAGLIGQLRGSMNMTRLARYTRELYQGLEAETGQATGYRQCGSVSIATAEERFEELKRNASMAQVFGLSVDVVTPEEISERIPLLYTGDVIGGIHIPTDGYANAVDITQALAKGAPGLRRPHLPEREGHINRRRLGPGHRRPAPNAATWKPTTVVLCAGMWTRDLAASIGVNVPLHALRALLCAVRIRRGPGRGPAGDTGLRRLHLLQARRRVNCWWVRSSPRARPWGMDGIPEDFCFDEIRR